jgi:inorganic pyrophosphatase
MFSGDFWQAFDSLLAESEIVIDRPRGSAHPRYPDTINPLDYGYLQGTTSQDGAEIDVWRGSQSFKGITALIITVDLQKRDTEVKLLLGCTLEESHLIRAFHDSAAQGGFQSALLVFRYEQR